MKREIFGSSAAKKIRDGGECPGVIYGPKCDPIHVTVNVADFEHLLRTQKPMLHPFKVDVAGKKQEVLVKSLDATYNGRILHVDFLAIAKGARVHVSVPLQFEHEDQCVGKLAGGVVDHHITALDIEVLPKDIPDSIHIDIASLEIGEGIHLSALKLPKGVTLMQQIDENHDPILVSCEPPKVESEPEEPQEEVAEETEELEAESESDQTQET